MAEKFDVLGIGNAIVDILTHVEDEKITSFNIPKGSMQLVDEMESNAIYKKLGQCIECSGGSAANTIAALASMGSKTSFIGKIKRDQLGAVFKHDIKSLGTDFKTMPMLTGPSTAHCLVLVTPDAERTMCTYLGACGLLSVDDIDEETVRASNITYLEGYLWDPEPAKEAFRRAIEIAKHAGNQVAFTLSDGFCVDRHRSEFLYLAENDIDILFANEDEVKKLYGTDDLHEAVKQAQADCHIAVVTRSEKGCIVTNKDNIIEIEGNKVPMVKDTTGAGDGFAAGFLHGISRDQTLAECGALGNLIAGEVITHLGARPDIDLKKFVEDNS